jgi:hypothetical protein
MVNYELGKIYKIVSGDLVYIGSTCEPTLARRMATHKGNYRKWKKDNKQYLTAFKVLENDDAYITLVELYPCKSSDELHARERFYIESTKCVNKNIPGRTTNECYEKYYRENQDKILQQKQKYYKENQEKMKEPILCICGSTYQKRGKLHHFQTRKHKNNIDKSIQI